MQKKRWGVRSVVKVGQDGGERRIEVILEMHKKEKKNGEGQGLGVRVDVNEELKKMQKKIKIKVWGPVGGGGVGGLSGGSG